MSRKTVPRLLSRRRRRLRRLQRYAFLRRIALSMALPLVSRLNYGSIVRRTFIVQCVDCGLGDRSAGADAGCGTCLAAIVVLT